VAIAFDYDLGGGKRGGAAVVVELPDGEERSGGGTAEGDAGGDPEGTAESD
jgi:hypothetical protein